MRKSQQPTPIDKELTKQDLEALQEILPKFEQSEKYLLCQWIKERIEYKKKLLVTGVYT